MTKNSPTLGQGEQYLSVTATVPLALSERIVDWHRRRGLECPRTRSHITLHIAAVDGYRPVGPDFEKAIRSHLPLAVSVGKAATFLPTTPVTYLPLVEGLEGFESLHDQCKRYLGPSASPFDFVPHLTVAHQLEVEDLQAAVADFSDLPEDLARFMIEEIRLSFFDGKRWSTQEVVRA